MTIKANLLSLLIRAAGVLLSAGQTVLLARALGAEELGVYSSVLAVATLVILPAPSGVSDFLYRDISRALADGAMSRVRGLRRAAARLGLAYAAVAAGVLIVLYRTDVLPELDPPAFLLMLALALTLGLDPIRAGAMRGMGSALLAQVPENVIRPGTFMVCVLGFVLFLPEGLSVTWALAAFNLAGVAALAFGVCVLRRWVPRGETDSVPVQEAFRSSTDQTVFVGTQLILANMDIVILSTLGYFAAAGHYRVALLGIVALLFVYNALAFVAVRDMSVGFARGDEDLVTRAVDRLTLGGLASVGAITVSIVVFGRPVVGWVFGAEFMPAADALAVLAVGHLVSTAFGPSVEMIRLLDSRWFAIASNGVGIALVLLLSLVLTQRIDPLLAVAVSSACGNTARRAMLGLQVSRRIGRDTTLVGTCHRLVQRRAGG